MCFSGHFCIQEPLLSRRCEPVCRRCRGASSAHTTATICPMSSAATAPTAAAPWVWTQSERRAMFQLDAVVVLFRRMLCLRDCITVLLPMSYPRYQLPLNANRDFTSSLCSVDSNAVVRNLEEIARRSIIPRARFRSAPFPSHRARPPLMSECTRYRRISLVQHTR